MMKSCYVLTGSYVTGVLLTAEHPCTLYLYGRDDWRCNRDQSSTNQDRDLCTKDQYARWPHRDQSSTNQDQYTRRSNGDEATCYEDQYTCTEQWQTRPDWLLA